MKKTSSRSIWFILMIVLIYTGLFTVASAEIVASGTCGDATTWVLDDAGTLTISGSGEISSSLSLYQYRDNVKSLIIEEGVTRIGYQIFTGYTGLKNVKLPDSLTSIGPYEFRGCTGLTSITFPKNIEKIDYYAFDGCTGLTAIEFPSSLTTIGHAAFSRCDGLTSITIPSTLTSIDNEAFASCANLASVNMESIADKLRFYIIFSNCPKLISVNIPSDHRLYSSKDGIVFNKAGNELLFYPQGKQGAYSIPNDVTEIGISAFQNCAGLTSIFIPENVESISGSAFENCTGLTSVAIPEGIKTVPSDCFNGCTNLREVLLPRSLQTIGKEAFKNCALNSVTLYGKVRTIRDNAFDQNVVIRAPEGSYAAQWAYDHYYTIETFAPEYYITVSCSENEGTVSATPSFGTAGTVVTLKATPKEGYVFSQWHVQSGDAIIKKDRFTIGSSDVKISAEFIHDDSFAVYKGSLYKLNSKKGTAIYVRPTDKGITNVTIPATIKTNGLKYAVVEIAAKAFDGCTDLKKCTIGKEIEKIGKNAFDGCKGLKTIIIKTVNLQKKSVGKGCFKNIAAKPTFKCPKNRMEDYKNWFIKTGKAPKKSKFK